MVQQGAAPRHAVSAKLTLNTAPLPGYSNSPPPVQTHHPNLCLHTQAWLCVPLHNDALKLAHDAVVDADCALSCSPRLALCSHHLTPPLPPPPHLCGPVSLSRMTRLISHTLPLPS
jgi:hypothetical protein